MNILNLLQAIDESNNGQLVFKLGNSVGSPTIRF